MTNAEKYLKPDMKVAMWKDYNQTGQKCKSIWQWLDQEAKPTLTEDERVILSNIKIHDCSKVYSLKITRACDNDLWLKVEGKSNKIKRLGIFIDINSSISIDQYSHLFQFIKERRRIFH